MKSYQSIFKCQSAQSIREILRNLKYAKPISEYLRDGDNSSIVDLSKERVRDINLKLSKACYSFYINSNKTTFSPTAALPVSRPARDDDGSVVLERRTQKNQAYPQMYQVVMLNDDYTPWVCHRGPARFSAKTASRPPSC